MDASPESSAVEPPVIRSGNDVATLGVAFQLDRGPDGCRRLLFVSESCLPVNGVSAAEAMADPTRIYDLIVPEHRAAFDAAEAAAMAAVRPLDVEVAMTHPDGVTRWRRICCTPRPQPDGALLWDGLQLDITERRQMAAELSEHSRRLAMAVEATGLGFWEWDVTGDRVEWSERNRALFGLAPQDEVTLRRYLELVHPDDMAAVDAAFRGALAAPVSHDYAMEHRVVLPSGEVRWILAHGRIDTGPQGEPRLVVGTSLDITARRAEEERRTLLVGELAHRAKNGLAILMAIVAQTARGAESVRHFEDMIMARLQAMATSQDLATAAGGGPVALSDVFETALAPFGISRLDLDPGIAAVIIPGEMAAAMGLLLHEMSTNAVKYGALSNDVGRVTVTLEPAPAGKAAFVWRETGGPAAAKPNKPGFGTRLLQMVLRPQGGEVAFAFEPLGFRARAESPIVL